MFCEKFPEDFKTGAIFVQISRKEPELRFVVISIFPESLNMLRDFGITSRAHSQGLWSMTLINPRDYSDNKHRRVDDRPYGGGAGMVMQAPPLRDAIKAAKAQLNNSDATVVYLSPQGLKLSQTELLSGFFAHGEASQRDYILLCGRYEGIDERLLETYVDIEVSIGDFVLSGGELPAMVLMDAMIRLVPGACGHEDSAAQDSFSTPMLDFAQYTRPESFEGRSVPGALTSGNHQKIADWRKENALKRTQERRSDLLVELNNNINPQS